MSNWEGVREFVAVAECHSFTKAARELQISVAHISRQVSALENRLGTKLLHRTTRMVKLNEEGNLYYQHCRHIMDCLDEAERAISDLQRKPSGTLRISAPVVYGERYIAPLLNQYALLHPQLRIELQLSNRRVDLIQEGFDLAIRLGVLEDSPLVAKKLAGRTLSVCASPAYIARHGSPHTLSELDQHNCLLGTLDYWRFRENGSNRTIRVGGSLRCNSGLALLDAALHGIGLVQLPDYYLREALQQQRLISLLDQYQPPEEGIWALYPPNRRLSLKVRLLIAHLQQGIHRLSDNAGAATPASDTGHASTTSP